MASQSRTCGSWLQVRESMEEWYNSEDKVAFAYIEAPAGSGKSTVMVQHLRSIAATSATANTRVTYAVRKPEFQRINHWFQSLRETPTENSLVDFLLVPDDAIMKGRSLLSEAPKQLLILDHSQELDAAYCFAMLTVAMQLSVVETEKVRVVWLGSGPWDALLSGIMALGIGQDGVNVKRINLEAPKDDRTDIDDLSWKVYDGIGQYWDPKRLREVAAFLVDDYLEVAEGIDSVPQDGPFISEVLFFCSSVDDDDAKISHLKGAVGAVAKSMNMPINAFGLFEPICIIPVPIDPRTSPPPRHVRHIILQDCVYQSMWSRDLLQVIEDWVPPCKTRLERQASVAFGTQHSTDVTIHSLWSREDTKRREVGRKFEEIQLASFLLVVLSEFTTLSYQEIKDVFLHDAARWSAAIQRLQRSQCISCKDETYDWKLIGSRAKKMGLFMTAVDFDFSIAHFLAGMSDKDPVKLQTIMMEIAAMSMRSRSRDECFGYDMALEDDGVAKGLDVGEIARELDDDCYGLPRYQSFYSTLLLGVGLHRKAVQDMPKATGHNWTSTRARVVIPRRLTNQTLALVEDLRSRAKAIGTVGEDTRELNTQDWTFIQTEMLLAWFHRLTIVDIDAEGHTRVMMPWPTDLIVMDLQDDQGFFPLLLAQREGSPLFMVGNSVAAWTKMDGSSTLTLMAPTCIPKQIVMNWLNSNGVDWDMLGCVG